MTQIQKAKQRLLSRVSSNVFEKPQEDSSEFKIFTKNANSSSIPKLNVKMKDRYIKEVDIQDNDAEFQNTVHRLSPNVSKTERKQFMSKSERFEIMSQKSQNIQLINRSKPKMGRNTTQYSQNEKGQHQQDYSFSENDRSIYEESPTKSNINRKCVHAQKLNLMIAKIPQRRALSPFKPRQCESEIIINEIIAEKHKNTMFVDDMFPPRFTIIFNKKYMNIEEGLKLERVSKIYETTQIKLINFCQPVLMIPGKFTSPALYSALVILSQNPTLILNIFGNQQYNQNGIYHTHICKDGVWRYIKVDDNLPTKIMNRRSLLFLHCASKNGVTQFWPAILQKALAKVNGTYQDIFLTANRGVKDIIKAFTGFPVSQYYINKDFRSYLIIIDSAIKRKQIVILQLIYENYKETAHLKGIQWDQSYQIIQVNKNHIILRNVSDKQLITKLTFQQAMIFNKLLIFKSENNYSYTSRTLRHKNKSFSIVKIETSKFIKGYWDVWENNQVYYKSHIGSTIKYQKSLFTISIEKQQKQEQAYDSTAYKEIITQSGKEVEMEAGVYYISIHLCQKKQQDFTLSFYGEQLLHMQRIRNKSEWAQPCQC